MPIRSSPGPVSTNPRLWKNPSLSVRAFPMISLAPSVRAPHTPGGGKTPVFAGARFPVFPLAPGCPPPPLAFLVHPRAEAGARDLGGDRLVAPVNKDVPPARRAAPTHSDDHRRGADAPP